MTLDQLSRQERAAEAIAAMLRGDAYGFGHPEILPLPIDYFRFLRRWTNTKSRSQRKRIAVRFSLSKKVKIAARSKKVLRVPSEPQPLRCSHVWNNDPPGWECRKCGTRTNTKGSL